MEATNGQPRQSEVMNTLSTYVAARKGSLAQILPKHLNADRMIKIALASASRNPRLLECTAESFYVALHTSAQLGLEPNGPLGHAYLIPYRNKNGKTEAQFQPGYKGLIHLARQSGQISTLYAYEVRQADKFKWVLGLNPDIQHEPSGDPESPMTHAYAVAKLKDGGTQFVVMTKLEIDAIRKRSKSSNDGPWCTDYGQMALKTVIKRLCKYLPMSTEMADAIEHDNDTDIEDLKEVAGNMVDNIVNTPQQLEEPKQTPMSGLKSKLKSKSAQVETPVETKPTMRGGRDSSPQNATQPQAQPQEKPKESPAPSHNVLPNINTETGEVTGEQSAIDDLPDFPEQSSFKKPVKEPVKTVEAKVMRPEDYKPPVQAKQETEYAECIPERIQKFQSGMHRTYTTDNDSFDTKVSEFIATIQKAITGKNKLGLNYIVTNGVANVTDVKII